MSSAPCPLETRIVPRKWLTVIAVSDAEGPGWRWWQRSRRSRATRDALFYVGDDGVSGRAQGVYVIGVVPRETAARVGLNRRVHMDALGSGEGDARSGPTLVHGRDKVGIVRHRAVNAQLRFGGGDARGRRAWSYAVPMVSMETANSGLVNWLSPMALRRTRTHEHCCPVGDGGMTCGSAEALPAKRAAAA
jgi:hypothetical protein